MHAVTSRFEIRSERSLAARYQALIRLAESVREQRDPEALFRVLVRELRQVVEFDTIAQFDEASNKVNWDLCEHRDDCSVPPPSNIVKEDTLPWWVFEHQQAVVIPFVESESRFPGTIACLKQWGLQSVCALPLSTAHRRLGSLALFSERPDAYSAEEVTFLSLAADQIALAIDDAVNFQSSRQAQGRLELLLDLTNRVVASLELCDLLREISASIRRLFACDAVGVILPDLDGSHLRLYALDYPGSKGIVREGIVSPAEEDSVFIKAVRKGEGLLLGAEDLAQDPVAAAEGIKSECLLPLTSRNRNLGALVLGSQHENAFSQDDVTFLGQVASQVAIGVENALAYAQISDLKEKLSQEKLYLEDEIRSELNFAEIVGSSEALRRVLKQVETVAPTDSTVLIYGETGTGKELIARAVHNLSSRSSAAFVKLNCAAIPTGLLESELFGHERGAFTGAIAQRIGRFELANRGTVFLDEIGEIPLDLQPKLLRVLQEREFERLGSSRTLRTDARLVAATNRDLEAMVAEQKFRADLFYRLNVFPIRVPPLRERPEDIPLLVRHFVQQFSRRINKTISSIASETMTALVHYHWPGNIRELQNVIERAVIVSTGSVLNVSIDDVRPRGQTETIVRSELADGQSIRTLLENTEREQILNALEKSGWVVAGRKGAAALLGMKRSTLQSRMQKFGIHVSRARA